HVSFTNLKCESLDKKFSQFETCHIKAVNRTHKYIDIYSKLKVVPVHKVEINLKLMRYNNGYKPFFVDITFDACKFLRNPNKNPIVKIFYNSYVNSSNLNHTCPYDHDVILDKWWTGNLEKDFGRYIPIPNGDYAIYTEWTADGALRASVKVYIKLFD
ncbi:hypothetical protein KR032_001757, partial [Drosophila birchii]